MALDYKPSGDAEKILGEMAVKIKAQGGTFTGDLTGGTFNVRGFGGTFRVDGGALTISINDKPLFVPDSMIEAWLRQNLG